MTPCECGCGVLVSRRFAQGHNIKRTPSPDRYVVDAETGCWLWQGSRSAAGYGTMRVDRRYWSAHRFHYVRRHGEVPEGHDLHHVCGVRWCVNPEHLELIEHAEHTRRHQQAA